MIIVAHFSKTWVLARILDNLIVGGVSLRLRDEHGRAALDLLALEVLVLSVLARAWRLLHVVLRLALLFAVESLLVARRSLHHLRCQGDAIIVLAWPGRDDFLATELLHLASRTTNGFRGERACKARLTRREANVVTALVCGVLGRALASEARLDGLRVTPRADLLAGLEAVLLRESLYSRAEELEALWLGLRLEATLLPVEVLTRTRALLVVIALEDVVDGASCG